MKNDYSIKEMLEEFRKDMKETLVRIEAQTIKTNGRVSSLEKSRTQVWTAISIMVLLGGTLMALAVKNVENGIDSKINRGIQLGLDSRVESVKEK